MTLSELYDQQPLFVEKLPGTPEFKKLCNKYRASSGDFEITDAAIWQRLNAMRKRGELNPKADHVKKVVVETWGKLINGKYYEVPRLVGVEEIQDAIYLWLVGGGIKPVTRLECWNIVKSSELNLGQTFVTVTMIEAVKITKHLFPELVDDITRIPSDSN